MSIITHEFGRRPDLAIDLYRDNVVTDRVYATQGSLVNASLVWSRLLDSENGFQKLATEVFDGRTISLLSLPDDDVDSMLVLLKIIHYQNRTIPKTISYGQLLEIAILCDKYDCGVAEPWAQLWIENLLQDKEHDVMAFGHEGWLRISRVFASSVEGTALVELVARLSHRLIIESCQWQSEDAATFVRQKFFPTEISFDANSAWNVSTDAIPSPMLNYIWNERRATMGAMVSLMVDFYQDMRLSDDETSKGSLCKEELCEEIAVGTLIKSLRGMGLPINMSVRSMVYKWENYPLWLLRNRLRKINVHTVIPGGTHRFRHFSNGKTNLLFIQPEYEAVKDLATRIIKNPTWAEFQLPPRKQPDQTVITNFTSLLVFIDFGPT
ncbi:hypothetical protein H072_269 [Dactylellina haptotyla CBS 200.50]|uniref:BTB domain-containing protein n=1 Tax=Dactylellina haptotyla (strain CBS 200.50) TaxID=1284197 RepID=S8C1Y1_DACHA|nr:hypothetical protein H072_269 [Dactylellina haptotyla CBS 200.50]